MKTVAKIDKEYLCTGCGACAVVCPEHAIKMLLEGVFSPYVDETKCIGCGKCVDVCPGISVHVKNMADKLWPNNDWNLKLGRFQSTYTGYSNDSEIRFNAASGGIATSLICNLIRKKIVDGAIVTRMSHENPVVAESFIARTEDEIISACTSKYCPTSPVALVRELKCTSDKEKFAFVGLPCQIHGIRKLQSQERWIREKIILTVGLFCAHGVTSQGTEFLLKKLAKGTKNVEKFQYRGRGWPGGIYVRYDDGEEFNIPHDNYWSPFFAPYFFTPYRCLTCHDLAAELADISVGDAWLDKIKRKDNNGTSVIIVRSEFGEGLLTDMKEDGEISLYNISYGKVIESQKKILMRKKQGVYARMKIFKGLCKPVPIYDQEFSSDVNSYIWASLIYFNAMVSKYRFGEKMIDLVSWAIITKRRVQQH